MSETSTTFGGWSDRLTYVVSNAQIFVLGLAFTLGAFMWIYQPSLPGIPPIVESILASILLFFPPLFGFFVTFVRWLRKRRMVEVHHVNGLHDQIEKWYVEPKIWREKKVDGPNPYPVNEGGGWAVREFDWDEDLDTLRVSGVWLEQLEDTKLLTKKSHFESMYDKLVKSHITLNVMRDSMSELGADVQYQLVNEGAEAREKGTLMKPDAVKKVFDDFMHDMEDTGPGELPILRPEEIAEAVIDEPKGVEFNGEKASTNGEKEAVATDD